MPIKFRGQTDGGKYVYGYYVPWSRESNAGIFTLKEKFAGYAGILTDDGDLIAVKTDSVKQLVGYDRYGNELYEGDKLVWLSDIRIVADELMYTYEDWGEVAHLLPCVKYEDKIFENFEEYALAKDEED